MGVSGFQATYQSGLSVAGLLLPEAVAYAGIGNMPPEAGVMALFVGLLCYGLLGGSRFAIVSATSSSAAVLFAATGSLAGGDPALPADLLAQGMPDRCAALFGHGIATRCAADRPKTKPGRTARFLGRPRRCLFSAAG